MPLSTTIDNTNLDIILRRMSLGSAVSSVSVTLSPTTVITPTGTNAFITNSPTWAAANFNNTAYATTATQNGTNTQTMWGSTVAMVKATGATTLATMIGHSVLAPTVTGTVTASFGYDLADQTNANITTPRGFRTQTGVANAFVWGTSALQYATGANNLRFTDSTNVGGIDWTLSTTNFTTNTISTGLASLIFQNQTFTAGATHSAFQITPTWATENFAHTVLSITGTQNGANTQTVTGFNVAMTKATGATTLATMVGFNIAAVTVTGTLTNSYGLQIGDQSAAAGTLAYGINILSQTANATTTRAVNIAGTGANNAIAWGASALQFGNAANNIRITDSTAVGGLDFNLTTTSATIRTLNSTTDSLILQTLTFTPGATHNAVLINPTWATENFQHNALSITATQNGTNTNTLSGLRLAMVKATGATTLATMSAITIAAPTITGTVTNSIGFDFADMVNVNATNSFAIRTASGVSNAFSWGASALQYANAANNIRFADSTNARGIDLTLTAAGVQTITTVAGNLSLSANSGIIAVTTSRHEYAKGIDVVSANDLSLGADGNVFNITGTTTINAITTANWQAGSVIVLLFAGALTLKHNTAGSGGTARIFLAASSDMTTAANTIVTIFYDGTQFQEIARKVA